MFILCIKTLCNMRKIMMKKRSGTALAGLLAISLCCSSVVQAMSDSFAERACAVGAAVVGVVGAIALADWYFSETDDQMIARVDAECRNIYSQYADTMSYFGQISGMNHYVSANFKPFNAISELVLHEFATYIWNSNSTQYDYRSKVVSAKHQLQSSVQGLRKRFGALEGKCYTHEDQRRFRAMRQLLDNAQELLSDLTMFVDSLEHHRSYFNLYDTLDTVRNRYLQELTIFESGRYSVPVELNRCIVSNGEKYALRRFVLAIESDIANLKSDIRSLAYNYPGKRQYANGLIQCLFEIKSIIMSDPRYQQELYEWEQARLHQLQLEAQQAQARAERDRVWVMREQNRILEERNRIERERLCKEDHYNNANNGDINVTLRYTL